METCYLMINYDPPFFCTYITLKEIYFQKIPLPSLASLLGGSWYPPTIQIPWARSASHIFTILVILVFYIT